MPAIIQAEDWATWLGEADASLPDVKAVLRTYEDAGNWTMTEQEPTCNAEADDGQAGVF